MMCHRTPARLVQLLVFLVAASALAQEEKPAAAPNPAPDEVVLFEGRQFEGDYLMFKVGDVVPNLDARDEGRWADRVSSIKVGADVIIVTWFDKDYSGWCKVFFGANAGGKSGRYTDLGKWRWDNRIDSVKVFGKDDPDVPCT